MLPVRQQSAAAAAAAAPRFSAPQTAAPALPERLVPHAHARAVARRIVGTRPTFRQGGLVDLERTGHPGGHGYGQQA